MSTVLLVEDDPDTRHLVSYEPSTGGFDVIEAAGGADALAQDIGRACAAGATDYVVKPFSPRDLLERVASAVREVAR